VDIKALVERVLDRNVDRSLESGHDLGAEIHPVRVTGNERLLEDLLGNLVDNALNYTPAGCHITVRTGSDSQGKPYLELEDDGPGIPAAERARVRERFYRMPASKGHGCGLGLAIVDEISRVHEADLTIDTGASGQGTRIRVTFKRNPTPAILKREIQVTEPPTPVRLGLRTASQSGEI
jgi:two-component system sensor histidine kinase TctE